MANSSNNYPLDLVARSVQGPPTIIRFVDEPCNAVPLSLLLLEQEPDMIVELPSYDDITVDAEARRSSELELPRFELPGFDPEVSVENNNAARAPESVDAATSPAPLAPPRRQVSFATALAAALVVALTLVSASALALASKALIQP